MGPELSVVGVDSLKGAVEVGITIGVSCHLPADNDMDLGALQNNVNTTLDNLYQGSLEQERARSLPNGNAFPLSERGDKADVLAGSDMKRSQPLLIHMNRWVR